MFFALICTDKPASTQLRMDTRPAHLEWIESHREAGRIRIAGPFLGKGDAPDGSLLIVDVPSETDARALAAEDPYAKAGLFAATEIRPWRWVVGNPDDEKG